MDNWFNDRSNTWVSLIWSVSIAIMLVELDNLDAMTPSGDLDLDWI